MWGTVGEDDVLCLFGFAHDEHVIQCCVGDVARAGYQSCTWIRP